MHVYAKDYLSVSIFLEMCICIYTYASSLYTYIYIHIFLYLYIYLSSTYLPVQTAAGQLELVSFKTDRQGPQTECVCVCVLLRRCHYYLYGCCLYYYDYSCHWYCLVYNYDRSSIITNYVCLLLLFAFSTLQLAWILTSPGQRTNSTRGCKFVRLTQPTSGSKPSVNFSKSATNANGKWPSHGLPHIPKANAIQQYAVEVRLHFRLR